MVESRKAEPKEGAAATAKRKSLQMGRCTAENQCQLQWNYGS